MHVNALTPKDWLFLIPIPDENSYLFYAPLHGLATMVTESAMKQLKGIIDAVEGGLSLDTFSDFAVRYITDNGLLDFPGFALEQEHAKPGSHGITLSLTNDCNLRCIYCYANAGIIDTTTMTETLAFVALEYSMASVKRLGQKNFNLTFHGGGEALTRVALLKATVLKARELAKELDLDLHIDMVTNATLISARLAKWMSEHNFEFVTVSLDGEQYIQNAQRPSVNGKGTFIAALRGIDNLKRYKIKFAIRATVTSHSTDEMSNFVRFIAGRVFDEKGGLIHFEPLSLCGKAQYKKHLDVETSSYVNSYRNARNVGSTLGIKVTCTLDTFQQDKLTYCGASTGNMFCVCPDGAITACSRTTKAQDKGSELFHYGCFPEGQSEPIISDRARARIMMHGMLPKQCEACYARWNCQGFCPISRHLGEVSFSESCDIIRKLLVKDMTEKI